MDLDSAFADGLFVNSAWVGWVDRGAASGVRADFEQDLVAEVAPQVPSITDLHRVGQGASTGLGSMTTVA
ncbi:hypothetical protein GCM10010185_54560 [Saccharothrix coeruleofusca]|uniref:Uncharacterized protein n=1 Tax=Saccharothrix coeruleofusca TaxID=33919 RepID=A0A918ARN0_9PSEU|nr:hypothetical protein GCM10010185_54560 [Saccharothrix coeruleofusca]